MASDIPRCLVEINYYQAAQEYLCNLPPEHFREATSQATQREITLGSSALVTPHRPDIHYFNELLVQYPLPRPKGKKKIGQVVPDNMVVIHDGPIKAVGSYDLPLQPARPFLILEYVSKGSKRKDYEDNMTKYEQHLQVPCYLLFYPDAQELTLYRLSEGTYQSTAPDESGHYPLSELEMEAAIVDGWVRFWFRGQLLPLPAQLQSQVETLTAQLQQKDSQLQQKDSQLQQQATQLQQKDAQLQKAELQLAALKAELERLQNQTDPE